MKYHAYRVPANSTGHYIRAMATIRIAFRVPEGGEDHVDTDLDVDALIAQGVKLDIVGMAKLDDSDESVLIISEQ